MEICKILQVLLLKLWFLISFHWVIEMSDFVISFVISEEAYEISEVLDPSGYTTMISMIMALTFINSIGNGSNCCVIIIGLI